MTRVMLEITGPTAIGGRRPGECFPIKVHDDGTPVDVFWRKRLADEAAHKCGAVRVVPDEPAEAGADAPAAAPTSKKGR